MKEVQGTRLKAQGERHEKKAHGLMRSAQGTWCKEKSEA